MSHITYVKLKRYFPLGVKGIITIGGSCWIGEVDDSTVLKYPHDSKDEAEAKRLHTEYKILSLLGQHPRIIGLKSFTDDGLYLERATNGDLFKYLANHPTTAVQRRLIWCRQAAEAIAYVHSKRILHCDLRHRNLLLDENLDLKLADFQGRHLSADGEVLLNGLAGEPCKFSCPRDLTDHADIKTDLFALGSTIYFIMMGHDVFPEAEDTGDDESEEEVRRCFRAGRYPQDSHLCSAITVGCWRQEYNSADEVVRDIDVAERNAGKA